jgi:hypothetical protein
MTRGSHQIQESIGLYAWVDTVKTVENQSGFDWLIDIYSQLGMVVK